MTQHARTTGDLTIRDVTREVVLDNVNTRPQNRTHLLGQLRLVLTDRLRPGDRVLLASYDRAIRIHTQLTDDPRLIEAGLASLETSPNFGLEIDSDFDLAVETIELGLEGEERLGCAHLLEGVISRFTTGVSSVDRGFHWAETTLETPLLYRHTRGVDLNRNFHTFSGSLPSNPAYVELHDLLLPAEWPPTEANRQAIAGWIQTHGLQRYQAAVSQGQYSHPDGLFFGGVAPTWSNQTLRQVLRQHGQHARRIAWIDLHTGLGPCGVGERIWAGTDNAQAIARARRWWDSSGTTPLTSIYDGSSTSAFLTGLMWSAIHDECPQAEYTGMALEYGTVPILGIIEALRGDHWLHRQHLRGLPVADELAQSIRQRMRDAFYVNTPEWRAQIVSQARQGLFQAISGLTDDRG